MPELPENIESELTWQRSALDVLVERVAHLPDRYTNPWPTPDDCAGDELLAALRWNSLLIQWACEELPDAGSFLFPLPKPGDEPFRTVVDGEVLSMRKHE